MDGERGQATVICAALMAALIGAAALSVDIGRAYLTQFRLQTAADSAALAGASAPYGDQSAATTLADQYAHDNNVSNPSVSFGSGFEVTVAVHRTVPTLLARVLGVFGLPVAVLAHAKPSTPPSCWGGSCTPHYPGYGYGGSSSTDTFTSTSTTTSGSSTSTSTTSSTGTSSGGPQPGSCPSVWDGSAYVCVPPGSNQFGLAPLYVVASSVSADYAAGGCAYSASGCAEVTFDLKTGTGSTGSDRGALALGGSGASTYQDALGDGSGTAVHPGDVVPTQTGNMSGPTDGGMSLLCSNDNNDPYIMVPVVAGAPPEGSYDVTIVGFAVFGVNCPSPGGGEITGHFVAAQLPGNGDGSGSGGYGVYHRSYLVSN